MKFFSKILLLCLLPIAAQAQIPTPTGNTLIPVSEGNNSWRATLNSLIGGRVGPDSTWVKLSGSYLNRRIGDNVYRYGTTGFRTTDTTGVVNVRTRTGKTGEVITMDTTGEGTVYLSLKPPAFDNVPQLQPFNFMTRRYQGVNAPYNPSPNFVWRFGYNQNTDGSRISTSAPAGGIDFEYLYHNASLPKVTEFHIYNIDSLGNTLKFITAAHNWNAARGGARLGFQSDLLTFNDKLSSPVWSHNPLTNIWTFADTVGFTFSEPRGFAMSVQNGANSASINLFDFNNTDTLEIGRNNMPGLKVWPPLILNNGNLYSGQTTDIKVGSATRETDLSLFGDFRLVKSASNNSITMLHTGDLQTWATNSVTHGFVRNDGFIFFKNFGSNDLTTFNLTQVSDGFGSPGLNLNSTSQVLWSSGANWYSSKDVGLKRTSAGVLDVTNGSSGQGKLRVNQLRVAADDGTGTTLWAADADGDFSKVTVSTGLSLSSNVLTATAGSLTGSGATNRIGVWSSSTNISSDADLLWDGTKVSITGVPAGQTDALTITNTNSGANDQTQLRFWNDSGQTASDGAFIGLASSGRSSPYANALFYWNVENGPIAFGMNNAEKARITSNGLIIGSTANAASKLDVEGGASIGATYSGTTAAPTNGAIIEGNVGVGNSSPGARLHVTTASGATTAVQRLENTTGDVDVYVTNATPESAITANPGDIAIRTDASNGKIYIKGSGTGNTGWVDQSAGGAGGHTIRDDGSDMTNRGALNFVSTATITATATDDSGSDETEITLNVPTDGITATQIATGAVGSAELASSAVTAGNFYRAFVSFDEDGRAINAANGGILDDGSAESNRLNMNFLSGLNSSAVVTDDSGNDESEIKVDVLSGSISPSQITADVDNYSPTDWSTNTTARVSGDNIWAITSFAALADGTIRRIVNIGTKALYVPAEHPDGTAANRVAGSTDQFIAPNGGIMEMYYDGTSSRWRVTDNTFSPANMLDAGVVGHYYTMSAGSTVAADWGALGLATASGGNGQTAPTSALPGGFDINTASSAAGVATLYYADGVTNPVELGSAHIVTSCTVYFPTLSDGTQTYTFQFGIIPTPTSTTLAVNNSVAIRYSSGINSGKFEGFSRNNAGTESTVDLGTTVSANTNYVLTVAYDKARAEARFYVNGAFAGRVTGSMPNAVDVGGRAAIVKTAGTTSRSASISQYVFYTIY